jgi:hypothetical protein
MITVLLQGRTGNNLFQYAVGRRLAIERDTTLRLDASWIPASQIRQIQQITDLPLQAEFIRHSPLLKRMVRKLTGRDPGSLHHGPVFREPQGVGGYLPEVLLQPDGVLLDGFFQCPQYADGISAELRRELDLSSIAMPPAAIALQRRIEASPSVSLHVRRGDYLALPGTQCLADNYFELAIEFMQSRHEGLRFHVFSDDPAWCRQRFKGPEFCICDLPGIQDNPLLDLCLMTACQHHIIVNSSYSWWGAWLNPNPEKAVIAPKMWMTRMPASRLVPESWKLI